MGKQQQVYCKCHHEKHNKENLFKVEIISAKGNKRNEYYCSEQIYKNILEERQAKLDCNDLLYQILGRKIVNTQLFKEVSEIGDAQTYVKLRHYLEENICDLIEKMNKKFNNEYSEIRYLMTIIKNNISDYRYIPKKEIKQEIDDIDYILEDDDDDFAPIKKTKKTRSLSEIFKEL